MPTVLPLHSPAADDGTAQEAVAATPRFQVDQQQRPNPWKAKLGRAWQAVKSHLISGSSPSVSGSQSQALTEQLERRTSRLNTISRTRSNWREQELQEDEDGPNGDKAAVDLVVVDRNFNDYLLAPGDRQLDRSSTGHAAPPDLRNFLDLHLPHHAAAASDLPRPGTRPNTGQSSRSHGLHSKTETTSASGASPPRQHRPVRDHPVYVFLRWRVFATVFYFFHSPFPDPEKEKAFIKETWFGGKPAALASAVFLLIAAIMAIASLSAPYSTYTKITYLSLALASVVPLFPLAALNCPRRYPWVWQVFLFFGVWTYPYIIVMDVYRCGFYTGNDICANRSFINMFYYALGFPVFGLFMLQASRLSEAVGAIGWVVLASVFIAADRIRFVRNVVNFVLFHCCIIYAQFLREKADRRMFSLREQLKQQYKATQKAQVAERQASESKRRFVSYIFHEVRVPLNTALLAFQNLEAERAFAAVGPDQREMVTGLSSSLITMEKVLNDVLDFNRMEAGKLTWTNKPFNINTTFRAMLMAFRGVAAARKIELITDFDPAIDAFSPMLLGDEMRFSQVISNLTSNACKFTQDGSVTVVTKLLYPYAVIPPVVPPVCPPPERRRSSLTLRRTSLAAIQDVPTEPEYRTDVAIVRIEISDTGVGIPVQDFMDNRLFSPYVQTDVGRRQGGKGSGLGLALVRKIVKLSGGRLGVTSVLGKGSTFWLEMPFKKPSMSELDRSREHSPSASTHLLPLDELPTPSPHHDDLQASMLAYQLPRSDSGPSDSLSLPALSPIAERSSPLDSPLSLQVLVVDDDPLTRKLLHRLLERLGCHVSLATNGHEALKLLLGDDGAEPRHFDMISLDNSMPVKSGVDTVRALRQAGRTDFVVGATGNALRADQVVFLEAGADMVLTKPVLLKDLKAALSLAASRRSASATPT